MSALITQCQTTHSLLRDPRGTPVNVEFGAGTTAKFQAGLKTAAALPAYVTCTRGKQGNSIIRPVF